MHPHKLLRNMTLKMPLWGYTAASALIVAGLWLAAFTSTAGAAVTHEFLPVPSKTLSAGVPASEPEPIVTGPMSGVNAMTADGGDVWVAETLEGLSKNRVDEFDGASGAFITQLPWEREGSSGGQPRGIAVGHATGEREVYVASGSTVSVFGPDDHLQATWTGAGAPSGSFVTGGAQIGGGGSSSSSGVAVDGSQGGLSDWAAGDVYVDAGVGGGNAETNVVDVYAPAAGGAEPAKTVAQLTGTCPLEGATCTPAEMSEHPFANPSGVAVSAFNGDVFVVDNESVVDVFAPVGLDKYEFVRQMSGTPAGPFQRLLAVAVDGATGELYLNQQEEARGSVLQFDSGGTFTGRLTGTPERPFHIVHSVAVDPGTHHVYVGDYNELGLLGFVYVYGPDLAIPDVTTGEGSEESPTGVTLNGTVNPDGAGEASCQFVYGTSEAFGKSVPCSANVPDGSGAVAVQASLQGLLEPDTTYFYRLQATNLSDGLTNPGEAWQTRSFTTPGPGIHGEWTTDVAGTSATVNATIDPHGVSTSYYFQYGTEPCATAAHPCAQAPAPPGITLGAGSGDQPTTPLRLQGLAAGAVYHWRIVVLSEVEGKPVMFEGADQTFTTQPAGSGHAKLPDGRAWELVSPPDKHGALLEPIAEAGVVQASAAGTAVTYVANAPTESGAAGFYENVQVLSSRANGTWSSRDISLPHSSATGSPFGQGNEFRYFTADLSRAAVEPFGEFTSLAPEVFPADTERTPYVRNDATCPTEPERCFTPLLTSTSGYADVPAGTSFGGSPAVPSGGARVAGTSPDAKHIVLYSTTALTLTPTNGQGEVLYEWSQDATGHGRIKPVSALPGAEQGRLVSAVVGEANTTTDGKDTNARGAISADGERVFWSPDGKPGLYMRDLSHGAEGETLRLDTVQGGTGAGPPEPKFQLANAAGTRALFTDEQALTTRSGARAGQPDLYECEVVTGETGDACVLRDLTPVQGEDGDVQGLLLGASTPETNSLFFVGGGAVNGAKNTGVESPQPGASNLYLLQRAAGGEWGPPTFIVTLSSDDGPDIGGIRVLATQTARVSANGRFVVFMSDGRLTGYDNRDAVTGRPDEEVYVYDSLGGGRLSCVSCNPSGGRPVGVTYRRLENGLVGGAKAWDLEQSIAANVPGWTPFQQERALYQSRYLSDDGRVFFNSSDALVPQDVNHNEDVYEYEPAGVGDCKTTSVTYSATSGGCVSLISSGTATGESGFLDASESGDDVFFLTAGQLTSQDTDSSLDVYDAHVCSSGSPCFTPAASSPACTTAEACRAAPSPQPSIFGSPASATFSGPGNPTPPGNVAKKARPLTRAQKLNKALRACKRDRKKRTRAGCEKAAKKQYAPVKKAKR